MFSIDTDKVKAQASDLNEYSDELYKISKSIENIGNSVKMDYKYYTSISNVKNSISSISKSVGNRAKKVDALGNGLNTSVSEYIKAENDIIQGRVNAPQAGGGSGGGGGSAWGGNSGDAGNGSGGGGGASFSYYGDNGGWHGEDGEVTVGKTGSKTNIKDKRRNKNPDNDVVRYRSVDGEKVDKDEYDKVKGAKKESTIIEYKKSAKYDESLFGKSNGVGNKDKDEPYANYSFNVGRTEAEASFKAGIYQYDKNGKKIVAPSVNAKLGGSFSILNLEGEAGIGNDNLGIDASGEINVGKVDASIESNIDFFGKDGKIDPQVKISANAEAIAAEATGEVDVKILGTESTISAGVNVGVGAHADVGIEDGKIKCDLGVSLGVGFNVGFELDVGGMVENGVDAVKSGVKAVKSGAKSAWKKFKSWF